MRKLLLIGALVLIAAAAFAQATPPTNYEIYGATQFDYQMTGTEASLSTPALANFNFATLKIGFRAQIADVVKSTLEFDPRNGEFRLMYVDYTAMPGLTLTAGKTNIFYEQIAAYYGGARKYLVGGKYLIPGFGWAGMQVGSTADIGFQSGSDLVYTLPGTSVTEATKVAQDKHIYMWPAVAFKPDLGTNLSLEIGAVAQIDPQYFGVDTAAKAGNAIGLDGYFTVATMGLAFTNEFVVNNLNQDSDLYEYTYYAKLTYSMGNVVPTVYLVTDVVKDFSNDPNTAIGFELPVTVAKNFKINPMFSYAIANYNAFEANNAIKGKVFDKNDWTFGIRFDYTYSAKF